MEMNQAGARADGHLPTRNQLALEPAAARRQTAQADLARAAPIDLPGPALLEGQIRPEARASLSLRLLCRDRASAGDHSITGERRPPCHGIELEAGQIVVSLQSPRQDHSG